jgi:hypothetical protein
MDDKARIAAMVAEMRAAELVRALRHALAGAPYWRWEARQLLTVIDNGELPERRQEAA